VRNLISTSNQLVKVRQMSDAEFTGLLWYGTFTRVMRDIHDYRQNIALLCEKYIPELRRIEKFSNLRYIHSTLRYVSCIGNVPNRKKFNKTIGNIFQTEEKKIMTFAQQLFDEGRQDGMEKGIEKKQIEIVLRMLKYGYKTSDIATLTDLSKEQIAKLQRKSRK
jgi:hypothetical protein